ncbi:hypothetical protein [Stenotrophomonas maltophilia]|uniref:hypothetical protein n=1 Tax=Stenotrophomonas maltophilia TaxID=40324 RepID=UPI0015DE5C30|nr:hypothetical protein [Stenotrophomonas maltophilia]
MSVLDKALSLIFTQYKSDFRPRFGSRFSAFWGTLLLGPIEIKGLEDVHPDLRSSYYHLVIDRRPPRTEIGLKQWEEGSRLVAPTRYAEERYAGKAQFIATTLITFMLCLAASGILAIKGGARNEMRVMASNGQIAPAAQSCEALARSLMDGTADKKNPATMSLAKSCQSKY